jgi:hypothetical protein
MVKVKFNRSKFQHLNYLSMTLKQMLENRNRTMGDSEVGSSSKDILFKKLYYWLE